MGAHGHLKVIHGKMDQAAAELKKKFLGVPVVLVLLDRIVGILFGKFVFKLKGQNGKTVDENSQIQGQLRHVFAVP